MAHAPRQGLRARRLLCGQSCCESDHIWGLEADSIICFLLAIEATVVPFPPVFFFHTVKHLTKGLREIIQQPYPISRCLINKTSQRLVTVSRQTEMGRLKLRPPSVIVRSALTASPLCVPSLLQSSRQLHRLPGLRPRAGGHLLIRLHRDLGGGGGHGTFPWHRQASRRLVRVRPATAQLCVFHCLRPHL